MSVGVTYAGTALKYNEASGTNSHFKHVLAGTGPSEEDGRVSPKKTKRKIWRQSQFVDLDFSTSLSSTAGKFRNPSGYSNLYLSPIYRSYNRYS